MTDNLYYDERYTYAMDNLSREHISWLRAQNDRAENTIKSRERVLMSVGDAGSASRETIEQWWQSRAHLAPATRVADLSNLREFYKWCQIYDHLDKDPSIRLRAPRIQAAVYDDRISDEDIKAVCDKMSMEMRRAIYLGAFAGLRVSESAKLDWGDINSSEDTIRVTDSKGGKTRLVQISPELIMLLSVGVSERRGNVVTGGGEEYSAAQFQRKMNRAMKLAGAEFTTHDLRHRFGVAAYRATQDILAVGEMMGHSDVNTTKIYASADSEVKRKIASAVIW